MKVVLDSSIVVAALFPSDSIHAFALERVVRCLRGQDELFVPSIFMAEVVSGALRQGNPQRGIEAARDLAAIGTVKAVSEQYAVRAGEIVATHRLRGMDALYALVAIDKAATLITNDSQMLERAPCKTHGPASR